ncbi:hypothetical protein BDZ89DRAFT_1133051 [Hymenopellis radicata]|nr:hypothetical protein BDZ89DRAFT_1133051 [Hymenopellis radicata]
MGLFYNLFLTAFSSIGAFLFESSSTAMTAVISTMKYLDKFEDDPDINVQPFNDPPRM